MKRVLLEGTELSGKTTLAENVKQRLEKKGYNTTLNIGPIDKNSKLVNFPLQLAKRIKIPTIQEVLYTLSLISDGRFDGEQNEDFLIQERYYPSVMAYSRVFNPFGLNRHFGTHLRRFYGDFDYNVLVKADVESRLQRIANRTNKTKLDEMVEQNPQLSVDLECALIEILSSERNYIEIDTSVMNSEEATDEILRRIL